MKYVAAVPVFVIGLFLQMSVTGHFTVFGTSVNLLLCLACVMTFVFGETLATPVCALCCGFVYDICLSQYLGVYTISLFVVIVACIFLKRYLVPEHTLSMLIMGAIANVLFYHVYWVLLLIGGHSYEYRVVLYNMPIYIILNVIAMLVIYLVAIRFSLRHIQDRYFGWK